MREGKWLAGLLLLVAVTVVGCAGPGEAVPQGITVGTRARDFTLENLEGEEVSLSDFRGSVVLINLWAIWCEPCREEIPDLDAAYQKYRDEGFVVLGVETEDKPESVAAFLDVFEMSYPIVLDPNGNVMRDYRAQGLPTSFIVDRDGVIKVRHKGFLPAAQLEKYLADVMR